MTWNPSRSQIKAYTSGDCWRLALELRKRSNLPIVFLYEADPLDLPEPQDIYWSHVMIDLQDDRYLDINGAQSETEIRTGWKASPSIYDLHFLSTDNARLIDLLMEDQKVEYPNHNPEMVADCLLSNINSDLSNLRKA